MERDEQDPREILIREHGYFRYEVWEVRSYEWAEETLAWEEE